jgi:hypothetical protein
MKKHSFIIFLFFTLAITSCKTKEEPEDEVNISTPVFSAKGTIDGKTIDFAAGKSNYYMSTDFTVDKNNIYSFIGELKDPNCNTCASLKIIINNNAVGSAFSTDSFLRQNSYSYYNSLFPTKTYYKVTFQSLSTGTGTPTYTWDISNGNPLSDELITTKYTQGGTYNISLSSSYSNGCSSSLTQPIYLSPSSVGSNIDFNVNYIDSHNVLFNSIPVEGVSDVSWDFGDANTASGSIVTHEYATTGLYKVCLSYLKDNDTFYYCKNVNTADFSGCKSNFSFNSQYIIDSLNLSAVTVQWTDETGHIYSSKNVPQNASDTFKILESIDFKLNEKGQKTRQLKIEFSCKVSDGTRVIELSNIAATIAVAYP